jgi:hypothetical protein
MAKPLVLSLDGQEFPVKISKVDREKLYGEIDIEAFDENGNECFLRVLASDGKTLIDKGGTCLAVVNEDGEWVNRADLIALNDDGDVIEPVPSSFAAANALSPASVEEYLATIVKSVYAIEAVEGADLNYLGSHLAGGDIFKFPFSYRGGLEYDSAFVLANAEGIFMIVGTDARLQFLKLSQERILDSIEEQEITADEIDFDLL